MMKEIFPNENYSFLIDDFTEKIKLNDILKIVNKYNFFCCGFNKDIINSDIIKKVLSKNLIITVYSESNFKVSEANELWSLGVKSIFIDDPTDFNSI